MLAVFRTNSIAMYFQCETNDSQKWLIDFCRHDELKMEFKTLYQKLQPELKSFPNFDIDVSMTNYSNVQSIDAKKGKVYNFKRDK